MTPQSPWTRRWSSAWLAVALLIALFAGSLASPVSAQDESAEDATTISLEEPGDDNDDRLVAKDSNLAWQLIAGVRAPVWTHFDVGLKYRYFRVPPDGRDLNYSKFVEEGETGISTAEDYNSHNTERLDIEGIKKKLLSLAYVRDHLKRAGIACAA